ncbi:polysaccharide pyruvyl transferase family protein [Sediminibacillus massiliensis]|uniref:polysaccharide pyruvyl transferase family protein n=1 Tax=Sediminibacillus massiliensis TaxID=1926277 RepID=UPI0009887186|nr:polysaccharide pyruvyl transferase family protein [Sediminibacillus massiliensis]
MKKIVLYSHGGSGNRGCEAIVRGTRKIIDYTEKKHKFYLCSLDKSEDLSVGVSTFNETIEYSNYIKRYSLDHIIAAANRTVFGNVDSYVSLAQKNLYKMFNKDTIGISIGGDNYCYSDSKWLYLSNKKAKKKNTITILWGCSLEEGKMDKEMMEDLNSYDLIIARENITYNLLLDKGINKNTKLYPDPAFQLDYEVIDLPKNFRKKNTIGINLSPYIFKSKLPKNEVIDLYVKLIEHIIKTTDLHVALIPHVFWVHNNDLEVLNQVYSRLNTTNRVLLIKEKYNSKQLKYIISNCRMYIGARTHSTIAAYSSCVPTLVLGYSVKSRGIARDIFGSERDTVLPVQKLTRLEDLVQAFEYIREKEEELRNHLVEFMPNYKEKALLAGDEIKTFI